MRDYYLAVVNVHPAKAIQQIKVNGMNLNKDLEGKKTFTLIPVWKDGEDKPFIVVKYLDDIGKYSYSDRRNLFTICPPPALCNLFFISPSFKVEMEKEANK